jgi:LemA protein
MTAFSATPARRPNIALALIFLILPFLSACGYNTIPTAEENAKAAWSEVLNQYQRRADRSRISSRR